MRQFFNNFFLNSNFIYYVAFFILFKKKKNLVYILLMFNKRITEIYSWRFKLLSSPKINFRITNFKDKNISCVFFGLENHTFKFYN
jgi:hypothetical protein